MQTPVIVEIDDDKVTTDNVEHVLIATKHQDRYDVLKKIMNIIDPYICIIFANKRDEVAKITKQLREDGFKVGEVHGDLEPRERKQMMRRIHNNEYQYIVATDIAARELILMEFLMLSILNFQKNRIFIFTVVDEVVVVNILVFVIVCMILVMRQI